MQKGRGIAHNVPGVTVLGQPKTGAADRDLSADLVPYLAALRRCSGDDAAALVQPLPDELRGRLAKEMVRRPALFPAPAIRAVLACTPKPVLVGTMGVHAAAVAWRCYVVENVTG